MNAIETLISVLCDPEGKCCISGSDDDRRLIESALAELAQAAQQAPLSSLPSWEECQLRVSNSDFLAKRVAEGGYGAESDSKVATELHRFLYEYDDQDPYRSAWFRHRLEKVLTECASHGQAPAGATELAEADRRAGAAERKLAASKEDVARIEQVRDKMKDQWGVDRRVSFDVVWAEALALKAGTKSDSGVQEDAAWMPLTPELLTAIESGDLGNRFWIAAHNNNEPQIGVYEWRQGRNPHGFNSDLSRYGASEITHVLPYKPPALPAASKQGASHDR